MPQQDDQIGRNFKAREGHPRAKKSIPRVTSILREDTIPKFSST